MAKFEIIGKRVLNGSIDVYGAKNAAIKMLAASILIQGETHLFNVPQISDVEKLCQILIQMGADLKQSGHELIINTANLKNVNPDPRLVSKIRASVVLVGPLLARFGKVKIPHPGGDKIGTRPIDLHLKAFSDLGIDVQQNDFYEFNKGNKLKNLVRFEKISVTGTENILLLACNLAQRTIIENAAIEPEIIDLINFLNKAGANIKTDGRQITINGSLKLKSVQHHVIPDRIEAGTYAILAAATKSELKINHIIPSHLDALLEKFREMNIKFEVGPNFLYIRKSEKIRSTNFSTAEYPGLATDLQPPMGVLLTQAQGTSHLEENIFENRLGYLKELQQMGADIEILSDHEAEITGPTELSGAEIKSLDIRAGATLIIAGLIADGKTEISHAENIDRGYEKIEERLQKIGAKIKRLDQ